MYAKDRLPAGRKPVSRWYRKRIFRAALVVWLTVASLLNSYAAANPTQNEKAKAQKPADPHAGHQLKSEVNKPSVQQPTAGPPAITLIELEQMALKKNPTYAQAESAIRAAEGRRVQAGLLPNPIVGYAGEELAFRSFSNKSEHFFFIEQEIPLGGKLAKSKNIFEKERSQAVLEAEAQKLRIVNSVRQLYFEALGAQQLVEIRSQLAGLTNEAVKITEELMNVGQADQPDQLEIEIEAKKADLELLQAEENLARVWQMLAALVGDPSLAVRRLDGDLQQGTPKIEREATINFLLRESPEIRIARVKVERARAALERAKVERVPDMVVRGGLGYSTEKLELGSAPFPRKTGPEARIELGFRLPVFNRNQGNIAAAEAELSSAEREVQRVEFSLRAKLAEAFTRYQNASRKVETYRNAILPRAKKSFELYLASFRQMAAAYPQALIARRSYLQSQGEYVEALVALWQNSLNIQGFLLSGGLDAPGGLTGESEIQSGSQGREP
jgi:outer membrane protein, heavy metal efflux system